MTAPSLDDTPPIGGHMTVGTASPSVFDAGLPTLDYDVTATPSRSTPNFWQRND
jgi:hypothetical protein